MYLRTSDSDVALPHSFFCQYAWGGAVIDNTAYNTTNPAVVSTICNSVIMEASH